jgi:hypothetical protein
MPLYIFCGNFLLMLAAVPPDGRMGIIGRVEASTISSGILMMKVETNAGNRRFTEIGPAGDRMVV